jgi:hypothetical protein
MPRAATTVAAPASRSRPSVEDFGTPPQAARSVAVTAPGPVLSHEDTTRILSYGAPLAATTVAVPDGGPVLNHEDTVHPIIGEPAAAVLTGGSVLSHEDTTRVLSYGK